MYNDGRGLRIVMSDRKEAQGELIGPPWLTRFEKARILGARTLQISMGAPLLIEEPKELLSSYDLALRELEERVLPISIRRKLPDGTYQDVPILRLQDRARLGVQLSFSSSKFNAIK